MKFIEIISILVIVLAIILTFLNNCSLGRVFETFTSNVPTVPFKDAVDEVLSDLYPDLFEDRQMVSTTTPPQQRKITNSDNVSLDNVSLKNVPLDNVIKGAMKGANGENSLEDTINGAIQGAIKGATNEGFVGERCSVPSNKMTTTAYGEDGKKSRMEPRAWYTGTCSDLNDVFDDNNEIKQRLCGGINENYKGFDSSCPRKYRISLSGKVTTHPGYENNVCDKLNNGETCLKTGKYALEELNKKMNISSNYTMLEAKAIGNQILNCYVSMKENSMDDTGDYNDNFLEQIKIDTKNRIDNLINLRQMYGSEIKTGSYPRNRTPTQNTGNNNNNVETSNMNELNDFISKKRKIKQVCNFIKNSQNVNSNSPGVETNKRTTNQFGDICNKTDYHGLPQYTGNSNGGTYTDFENINSNDKAWHQSSKYPKILKTDPKPYNGIMSLF